MSSDSGSRDGFRLRGTEMTRLETFTDAAFAFAMTLLVISVGSVPSTYDELMAALPALPVFAASFAILMLFWYGHWQWSRRFGLEDLPSILLSLALVFTVLSYVYPLKFMWALFTHWLSDGALAGGAPLETAGQVDTVFVIYGAGFALMALLLVGLNAHAYRLRDELDLDPLERLDTRSEIVSWLLTAAVGALSVVVALLELGAPGSAGWVYMLMPILLPMWGVLHGRRRARLEAADAVSPSG